MNTDEPRPKKFRPWVGKRSSLQVQEPQESRYRYFWPLSGRPRLLTKKEDGNYNWDRMKKSDSGYNWDRLKKAAYNWDRLKRGEQFNWDRLKRDHEEEEVLEKRMDSSSQWERLN